MQNFLSSSLPFKTIKFKIHRTINLPDVLYGSKTWPRKFRDGHGISVFENRMLRKIFGSKRDEGLEETA